MGTAERSGCESGSLFLPRRVIAILLLLVQFQRQRIDAIAQACGPRAIVENMTQVRVATAAQYFGAVHSVRMIRMFFHNFIVGGRGETWPTTARVELGIGSKKLLATTDTLINAGRIGGLIFAGKGWFRTLLAGHMILIRRELLLPLGSGLMHFFSH